MRFRVSVADKTRLQAGAEADEARSLSAWILRAALAAADRTPLYTPDELATLRDLAEQLRRIGINLNQLVRALHTLEVGGNRGRLPDPAELAQLVAVLTATHDAIRARIERP